MGQSVDLLLFVPSFPLAPVKSAVTKPCGQRAGSPGMRMLSALMLERRVQPGAYAGDGCADVVLLRVGAQASLLGTPLREISRGTPLNKLCLIDSPPSVVDAKCLLQRVEFKRTQVFLSLIAMSPYLLLLDVALFDGGKPAPFESPQLAEVSRQHGLQLIECFHLPPPLALSCNFKSFPVLRCVTMGYAQNSVFSISRQASRNVSMSSA